MLTTWIVQVKVSFNIRPLQISVNYILVNTKQVREEERSTSTTKSRWTFPQSNKDQSYSSTPSQVLIPLFVVFPCNSIWQVIHCTPRSFDWRRIIVESFQPAGPWRRVLIASSQQVDCNSTANGVLPSKDVQMEWTDSGRSGWKADVRRTWDWWMVYSK